MANEGEKAIQGPRLSSGQQYLSNAVALLPTPKARDHKGAGDAEARRKSPALSAVDHLLPTPAVNDMGDGKTLEWWDAWTAAQKAKHSNGNGHGASLAIEAQRLLPTPRATDGTKGGPNQRGSSGDLMLPSAVHQLLPTPMTSYSERTPEAWRAGRPAGNGATRQQIGDLEVLAKEGRWGDYGPAIARWEQALGIPAPDPTETSAKGGQRLSPRFTEWMMGLPAGWITDVPSVTRNEALKLCGNGVVPQQALHSLQLMADRAQMAVAA